MESIIGLHKDSYYLALRRTQQAIRKEVQIAKAMLGLRFVEIALDIPKYLWVYSRISKVV